MTAPGAGPGLLPVVPPSSSRAPPPLSLRRCQGPLDAPQPLSVALSHRSRRSSSRVAVSEVAVKLAKEKEEAAHAQEEQEEEDEEEEGEDASPFEPTEKGPEPPTSFEIQSLLMELCEETDIAEFRLKVGSFLLHVKRDLEGAPAHAPAPAEYYLPPAPVAAPVAAPPPRAKEPVVEEEVDEGLLYVASPTVGILRRARMIKGKRGRNLVDVGSTVKAGQVVGYVEQLGTNKVIESDHAGEVVSFLVEEGVAVGYGEPIMAIRPSFPGIKKLA